MPAGACRVRARLPVPACARGLLRADAVPGLCVEGWLWHNAGRGGRCSSPRWPPVGADYRTPGRCRDRYRTRRRQRCRRPGAGRRQAGAVGRAGGVQRPLRPPRAAPHHAGEGRPAADLRRQRCRAGAGRPRRRRPDRHCPGRAAGAGYAAVEPRRTALRAYGAAGSGYARDQRRGRRRRRRHGPAGDPLRRAADLVARGGGRTLLRARRGGRGVHRLVPDLRHRLGGLGWRWRPRSGRRLLRRRVGEAAPARGVHQLRGRDR